MVQPNTKQLNLQFRFLPVAPALLLPLYFIRPMKTLEKPKSREQYSIGRVGATAGPVLDVSWLDAFSWVKGTLGVFMAPSRNGMG